MGKDITKQRLVKDRALQKVKDVAARTSLLRKTVRKAACLPSSLQTVNSTSINVQPDRGRWKYWLDRLTEARIDQCSLFSSY